MANELWHNFITGKTLYACRFKANGEVFISDGSSSEVWGAGGNDADDYDIAITESDSSGHYVGSFDASNNITDGVYKICIYVQAGANPADSDIAIAQGIINWKSDNAISLKSIDDKIDVIDGIVDSILTDTGTTLENHLTDIKGTGFVKDTDSLVDLAHIGADGDTLETLSDQLDTTIANTGKVVYGSLNTGGTTEKVIYNGSVTGFVSDEDRL